MNDGIYYEKPEDWPQESSTITRPVLTPKAAKADYEKKLKARQNASKTKPG